ncbi:Late competence protein ComEC, DNA transport [Vagococcus fluvialis bH819]|uniref:Late competence protein ComEC, DNA transport n=1 Tax=Vagococcus fluvialis bH819 TaxID=1255619 RepID=A0A1X6WQZ2_9ENTE|nr:Late competence protein ComEC, DNA transport [Vagococcus fluvialis bH819]
MLKEKKLPYLILFFIVLLRIICFRNKEILLLTGILILFSTLFWWVKLNSFPNDYQENQAVSISLVPDTIKVDGAVLSFEGKLGIKKDPVLITYILKNEKEKNFIENNKKTLIITGKVELAELSGNRNLNGFDYSKYLENKGHFKRYNLNEIIRIKSYDNKWYQIFGKLKEWRRACFIHNKNHFEELTQSYLNSLIFGFQNNGPGNYQKTWRDLGVAHLFSLSGMHIYFFLFIFDYLLLRCAMTKENLFKWNLLFTFFVMIMTGLGPGMVRAGLQHITKQLNRKYECKLSNLDCWSIALFINSLFDPYVLLTVGGQLTYYMTFLIIMLNPIIKKIKQPFLKFLSFNIILSTLSLPLIWYHFYEWNFLSFFMNLVLGSFILCLLMPILLISFLLSFVFRGYHFLFVERFLILFQKIGNTLNDIDFSHQVVGKLPLTLLVILIVSQLLILREFEKNHFKISLKFCFLSSVTLLMPFYKYMNPSGIIAFVDIGQGDAIFLQLPHHKGNYLLDTGGRLDFKVEDWQKRSDKRGADYTLIPFLKSRGVKKIDTVFISHAHEDHFGDLDRVSDAFNIKSLYFGEGTANQVNFKKMLNYQGLDRANKKIIKTNNSWSKEGVSLKCLFPDKKGDGQNNDSLVMMLTIKNKKFLLTGDLEKEGEQQLMANPEIDLKADVLKAGHHGSKTSTHPEFLERVAPELVTISCGLNNRYNHPSEETIENLDNHGIPYYETDEQGMIYFTWNKYKKNISSVKTIK